jgi:hypothetical protein
VQEANLQKVMTRIGAMCLVTIGVWIVIELAVQFGHYGHACYGGVGEPLALRFLFFLSVLDCVLLFVRMLERVLFVVCVCVCVCVVQSLPRLLPSLPALPAVCLPCRPSLPSAPCTSSPFLSAPTLGPAPHAGGCPTLTNMLVIVVGGIPIAMPTVLSVTLALGAFVLAKEGAIVSRMSGERRGRVW